MEIVKNNWKYEMYTKNDELGKNNIAYKKCGYVEYLIYKYIRYKCYTVIHMMLDFRGDMSATLALIKTKCQKEKNVHPKRRDISRQILRINININIYIYVFIIIYICIIYIYKRIHNYIVVKRYLDSSIQTYLYQSLPSNPGGSTGPVRRVFARGRSSSRLSNSCPQVLPCQATKASVDFSWFMNSLRYLSNSGCLWPTLKWKSLMPMHLQWFKLSETLQIALGQKVTIQIYVVLPIGWNVH